MRARLALLLAGLCALAGCQPGETPGGVGIEQGTPYFAFRLCPSEVITALSVHRTYDESEVWSATLVNGMAGTSHLAWVDSPTGYRSTGTPGEDYLRAKDDLYADAEGRGGRSLGRWRFSIADLRAGELLLGYDDDRYMDEAELQMKEPTGCSE